MISPPVERLVGAQQPRILHLPEYVSSTGDEAIELASMAGLELDPWQQFVLVNALGERPDGKWAAFEVGIEVSRQNGKGPHALDTPVLTTDGWTTFAEIRPGQEVYGSDGKPTRVVACSGVHDRERCYAVSFTDGSRHVVGSGHLWSARRAYGGAWEVIDTEALARDVGHRRPDTGRMECHWRVRCDAVIDSAPAELPIDPYIFGMWLGDGSSTGALITCGDEDIDHVRSALRGAGYLIYGERRGNSEYCPWQVSFGIGRWTPDGFLPRLRRLGVFGRKHIPDLYLTASREQRLALLCGLMDTDGSIATTNKSPQVEFSCSSEVLARDFHCLARSLGVRVTPKCRATSHKNNWRFLWTPTFNPFRLERKARQYRPPDSYRHELMSVTAVEPVESVPTRCIQVESEDGVYLVGRAFTPTHNSILEARELAGLFLLGERLLIHSAHEFATSLEAFHRLLALIESCPDFDRRVRRVSRSHGDEGIELKSGQRVRYRTRTKGGGRGFSADWVGLDEAMDIPEAMHGALLPTLSARPNPQVWYTGSAVDQESMDNGVVFARIRERALRGEDPSLAYFGWSPPFEHPSEIPDVAAEDPAVWAQANPGLGIRITTEHVAREQRSMDARTFAVERLGVGDWPATDGVSQLISVETWEALRDPGSRPLDPVCFAFDVQPDRSSAAIAAAGKREDGRTHIEVVEHRRQTGWLAGRLAELLDTHENVGVVCDGAGPAGGLLPALSALDVTPEMVSAKEHTQACGMFYDAAVGGTMRHLGTGELTGAVKGAATRSLGDAWAWSRKSSAVDISPLVSCTLALWGLERQDAAPKPLNVSSYRIKQL